MYAPHSLHPSAPAKSCCILKLWYRDYNNKTVQTVAFDTRKTYGAPSILTRRSHLQAELYRFATEPSRSGTPARVLSGVAIQSLDPLAGVLTISDGQVLRGDLIIGADGINSAVRAAVQAHASVPRMGADIEVSEGTRAVPTGLIGYITKVPAEVVMADPEMAFQAMNGVGGICRWEGPEGSHLRVICYATEGKRYWQILAYAPETDWISEFESTGKPILTDIPSDYAVRDFAGFHPSIKRLLGYDPAPLPRRTTLTLLVLDMPRPSTSGEYEISNAWTTGQPVRRC